MKSFKRTFALLLITIFTISCGGDDDSSDTTIPILTPSGYFLKAKIDGVQYTAEGIRVTAGNYDGDVDIVSVLPDKRNFEITLTNSTGVGTYARPTPTGSTYTLKLVYGDGSAALFSSGACDGTTGTLIITAISKVEVSGTFSFTAKKAGGCADAAKIITEGSFKAPILIK